MSLAPPQSQPTPPREQHDPANQVTAWASAGQLVIAIAVLVITLVAGELRLESRMTRIETLIEARTTMWDGQISGINTTLQNHEARIERLETIPRHE